jgi:hypothetical protein
MKEQKNLLQNTIPTNVTVRKDEDEYFTHVNGVIAMDSFIVPNSATYLSDHRLGGLKDITETIMTNDIDFNIRTDKLIELWHVTAYDDDVTSHQLTIDAGNGSYILLNRADFIHNLPSKMFVGKNEGETVDVRVEGYYDGLHISGEDGVKPEKIHISMDVVFSMCLAQQKYRYRRYGKFEDVFNRLNPELANHTKEDKED